MDKRTHAFSGFRGHTVYHCRDTLPTLLHLPPSHGTFVLDLFHAIYQNQHILSITFCVQRVPARDRLSTAPAWRAIRRCLMSQRRTFCLGLVTLFAARTRQTIRVQPDEPETNICLGLVTPIERDPAWEAHISPHTLQSSSIFPSHSADLRIFLQQRVDGVRPTQCGLHALIDEQP